MDATTIRVREPRELLALLPYQLGFQPRSSAVVVALRPPRGRVGLIARVDLTDLADPGFGPQLARRLVTHLVGDGAARAVLVVYAGCDPRPHPSDRPASHPGHVPVLPQVPGDASGEEAGAVLDAVDHVRTAAAGFLGDVPVWVVGPAGYLSLDCDDLGCCPVGGRPLRELQSTEVGAHMVLAGAMVADSREMLVPDVPAPAAARRNAVRGGRRWQSRRAAAERSGDGALALWRAHGLRLWRSEVRSAALGEPGTGAAGLGRLCVALADVVVRDAVLLTMVPGTADLAERSLAAPPAPHGGLGDEIARALAAVVSPQDGVAPDPDAQAVAEVVLERVVSHASGVDRAPGLTLLGLLAWGRGDGARAGVLLERALRADERYRLAHLLVDALTAGLPPGWVRAPDGPRATTASDAADADPALRYGRSGGRRGRSAPAAEDA